MFVFIVGWICFWLVFLGGCPPGGCSPFVFVVGCICQAGYYWGVYLLVDVFFVCWMFAGGLFLMCFVVRVDLFLVDVFVVELLG